MRCMCVHTPDIKAIYKCCYTLTLEEVGPCIPVRAAVEAIVALAVVLMDIHSHSIQHVVGGPGDGSATNAGASICCLCHIWGQAWLVLWRVNRQHSNEEEDEELQRKLIRRKSNSWCLLHMGSLRCLCTRHGASLAGKQRAKGTYGKVAPSIRAPPHLQCG